MEALWMYDTVSSDMDVNISSVGDENKSSFATRANATEPTMRERAEFIAAVWLVKYGFLAVIAVGTVGNVLSLVVLLRRRMRTNSVNFYLVLLAVADTCVLYLSGFKTWLRVISGFELLHMSNAGCKIIIFLFMFFSHASAWLIVLVTIDRFIAVWFPFKAMTLCSLRRARIICLVTMLILAIYNLHLLWTMHLFEFKPGHHQCAPLVTNTFMNGPYNFIKLATYTIVPFTIVLGTNAGIIACICTHSKNPVADPRLNVKTVAYRTDQRLQQNKHHVTVMLLVVSFTWLILTMPFTFISLVDFDFPDTKARAVIFLLKTVSFLLMYTNHSINFFLYCVAGKKFRGEFINMFRDLNASMKWRRSNTWTLTDRMLRTRSRSRSRSRKSPMLGEEMMDFDPSREGVKEMVSPDKERSDAYIRIPCEP